MKKRYLALMPILVLAGCGDVNWFPDPKVAAAPITNPQPSTSVTDTTGTLTARNLVVSEASRDASFVTVDLKAEVVNTGATASVNVMVSGKNKQGAEQTSEVISGSVATETRNLTKTTLVPLTTFQNISTWTLKSVSKP